MSVSINFSFTEAGQSAIFNANRTGVSLNLTHVQLGSGNRTPNGKETALVQLQQTVPIAAGSKVTPTQIRMAAIFTGATHYAINEVGIWSGDPAVAGSILVFYWSQASGTLAQKSDGVDFVFAHDMVLSASVPAGTITILADQAQSPMLAAIANHESKVDPHPQYQTAQEIASALTGYVPKTSLVRPGVTILYEYDNNVDKSVRLIRVGSDYHLRIFGAGDLLDVDVRLISQGTWGAGSDYEATRVANGSSCLASATATCRHTTGMGYLSLVNLRSGDGNSTYGSMSGGSAQLQENCTYFGRLAGTGISDRTYNGVSVVRAKHTALGAYALTSPVWDENCTAVGYNAQVTGGNQLQLGDSATTTYVFGTVQNRSDERDKADIRDTTLGLDFIRALRPIDYRWDMREDYRPPMPKPPDELPIDATQEQRAKHEAAMQLHAKDMQEWGEACRLGRLKRDGSKKRARFHHGFGAAELKATLDRLGVDFGGYQDHGLAGGDDVRSVGYDEFIAPLCRAVQQLADMADELKKEVADLKTRLR